MNTPRTSLTVKTEKKRQHFALTDAFFLQLTPEGPCSYNNNNFQWKEAETLPRLFTVKLTFSASLPRDCITVSVNVRKKLHLTIGQNITLAAGNRKVSVRFLGPHDSGYDRILCVADNVQQQLMLPPKTVLNLAVDDDAGSWRLGPLIGIFANRFPQTSRSFGEQTSFFRKLGLAATRQNSLCFVFGPEDIDWENKVVRGSIPPLPEHAATGWRTLTLPFPDVVYDRGLFPRGEKRRLASESRKILRGHPDMIMFNPAFFGKWQTHKLLSRHELLYQHLPETRLFRSMTDVYKLLQKHGSVYLKPSGGSSGKGIVRISRSLYGYAVNYRTNGNVNTREIIKGSVLEDLVKALTGARRFVVQQGLQLATVSGCPFDIRILMQRNRHGVWLRTGMAARVAKPGSYISNLHAGGHANRISAILTRVFPDLHVADQIINQIRRICALIASWVTAESNPLFGEIAIDLGIDVSGKIWIIELNAVPGRSVFRRTNSREILVQAISRPMEYAYYLAGFAADK